MGSSVPKESREAWGRLPPAGPHPLNAYQQKALTRIKRRLEQGTFASFLLYGVTGSGKTEVYARAVEHTIKSGRQAILMAPEILLAGYLEGVFGSRLGDRVALYHSGLSKSERLYRWSRMAAKEMWIWSSVPVRPCSPPCPGWD
jgi:primosomal protein N' (replication factor Y)